MRFPLHITTDMIRWQAKNWWAGNKRVPVVLMLEPLHTCNLACIGCSPERWSGDLKDRLPLEKCFQAVDECGAPVVSVCGGEPTVYPEIVELIDGIVARKKHVIMCTNAILLDRYFKKARPQKRLTINVHLDGMKKTHDYVVDKAGVFDKAIAALKEGKRLGYRMKSLVDPKHAKAINAVFTPTPAELRKAARIVKAFERARAAGRDRARVDGALIEVPIYAAAKRLLDSIK